VLNRTSPSYHRASLYTHQLLPYPTRPFFRTGQSHSSAPLPPQPITTMSEADKQQLETATVAAGCFWSVELIFQRAHGVMNTQVGYIGGNVANPSYDQVCSGRTGHAESVQVKFNPSEISYRELLQIFFNKHDPTTKDRQGNDRGTQYRSAIFYHSPEQQQTAQQVKDEEQKKYKQPICTEIVPASTWYPAEDYHQRYLEKGGQCALKGDKTPIRCYG